MGNGNYDNVIALNTINDLKWKPTHQKELVSVIAPRKSLWGRCDFINCAHQFRVEVIRNINVAFGIPAQRFCVVLLCRRTEDNLTHRVRPCVVPSRERLPTPIQTCCLHRKHRYESSGDTLSHKAEINWARSDGGRDCAAMRMSLSDVMALLYCSDRPAKSMCESIRDAYAGRVSVLPACQCVNYPSPLATSYSPATASSQAWAISELPKSEGCTPSLAQCSGGANLTALSNIV